MEQAFLMKAMGLVDIYLGSPGAFKADNGTQ